jgi:hypothetical protein
MSTTTPKPARPARVAPNPYTDARLELVTAYVTAGLVAFGYTPATLMPNTVVVEYGDPWLRPNRVGRLDAAITFTVTMYAQLVDYPTALEALEQLTAKVLRATPAGCAIDSVSSPDVDSTSSQGDMLAATLTLTAQVKE